MGGAEERGVTPFWWPTVHAVLMAVVMTGCVAFLFSLNISSFDDEWGSVPLTGAALLAREAVRHLSGGRV